MLFFRQLYILLWKNMIIRLQHPGSTLLEISFYFYPIFMISTVSDVMSTKSRITADPKLFDLSLQEFALKTYNILVIAENSRAQDFRNQLEAIFHLYHGINISSINISKTSIHLVPNDINQLKANISANKDSFGIVIDSYPTKDSPLFRLKMIGNGFEDLLDQLYYTYKEQITQYNDLSQLLIAINEVIFSQLLHDYNRTRTPTHRVRAIEFPKNYPDLEDLFITSIRLFLEFGFIVSFDYMVLNMMKSIVEDKSSKFKEVMKMMGMSDLVFWLSYFVEYAFISAVILLISAFLLSIFISINFLLLFIILMISSFQFILLGMVFSTVFNESSAAINITDIVLCLLFIVPFFLFDPLFANKFYYSNWRLILSFIPGMALNWNIFSIWTSTLMGSKNTIGFEELFKEGPLGSVTIGKVIIVQILSCIIYVFLIWYLDNVWPHPYGLHKPLYFPCLPEYYCPKAGELMEEEVNQKIENENFEIESEANKVIISLKNIRKTFGVEKAVNGVSLDIYEGKITILLGHNGAGKTTTMNMITGIYRPTSGTIHINGYDIVSSTKKARKNLGLCPQENVLCNDLTVRQHLKLFAVIKGYPSDKLEDEINSNLRLTQMTDKENTKSSELSGGLKRKLNIGIALIGKTKVLVMDEPTTGLDPENRRAIWDILQDIRKERTILLTTHYMEEADVLGDRIVIMSDGRVKCNGSPMFLKKRFGTGYQLRISKTQAFNQSLTESVLRRYLPESRLEKDLKTESIYLLESQNPSKQTDRNAFSELFDQLEQRKSELGIESYGVNATTMEDVFVKVGSATEGNKNSEELKVIEKYNKLDGISLFRQRIYGLLAKRLHLGVRNWQIFLLQILIPSLILIATFVFIHFVMTSPSKDKIKTVSDLDLFSLYGPTNGFFASQSQDWQQFGREVYAINAKRHGMTTSLISEDPQKWLKDKAQEVGSEDYALRYSVGGSVIGSANGTANDIEFWNNPVMIHSLPMSVNLMYESLINQYIPELKNKIKIELTIEPILTDNFDKIIDKMFMKAVITLAISCILIVPFMTALLASTYVMIPLQDKSSKFLQLMTGLSPITYWFSNFIYDFTGHLIAVIILLLITFCLDSKQIFYHEIDSMVSLILLLVFFGSASISIAYLASLFFKTQSKAFICLYGTNISLGFVLIMYSGVTHFMESWLISTHISYSEIFTYLFGIIPIFSMNFGFFKLFSIGAGKWLCREMDNNYNMSQMCGRNPKDITSSVIFRCCDNLCQNQDLIEDIKQYKHPFLSTKSVCFRSRNGLSFEQSGVGFEIVFLIISTIYFTSWLLIFEGFSGKINQFWNRGGRVETELNDDDDVWAERSKVELLVRTDKLKDEAFVVFDTTKYFKNFRAVYRLSFRVHYNECFGLLGVNGAGKTTTFQMITGEITPDSGNAFIGDNDLRNKTKSYQQSIGYCPQFNAFPNRLTGEEILYLFARLRGIPEKHIQREVQSIVRTTDIENHCKTLAMNLSGGNQRKLSLALAIVGSPALVLLDEPTSGVDPIARRKIWQTLNELKSRNNSSIILTSHTMDESEALCSRIAIMVGGEFKCFGSTQQLKNRYGQGFDAVIKIKAKYTSDKQYLDKLTEYMKQELPSALIKDFHQCLITYHISDPSVKWSTMFRVMQTGEQEFDFEDYSLRDSSLEQIFLTFAKQK